MYMVKISIFKQMHVYVLCNQNFFFCETSFFTTLEEESDGKLIIYNQQTKLFNSFNYLPSENTINSTLSCNRYKTTNH